MFLKKKRKKVCCQFNTDLLEKWLMAPSIFTQVALSLSLEPKNYELMMYILEQLRREQFGGDEQSVSSELRHFFSGLW